VYAYRNWLENKGETIEIISVNTEKGVLFVTYKEKVDSVPYLIKKIEQYEKALKDIVENANKFQPIELVEIAKETLNG
jgi:predicted nucleotide-binding protein (sugar kinase/HSP70/actin superfamily)